MHSKPTYKDLEKEEAHQRLANIILGIDAGTWEWNVQTGETLFNDRWAEIIGYTLEEMVPINIGTWLKYCHPDDVIRSNALLQKHFNQEESTYECEVRMRHKDGHWVWVLDRGRVVSRTPDGKPLWMYGTHIDITHHKRAEEDLKLMAGMLDEAPAYISIHDVEGRLLFANETAYKLHGYTREEFMSLRIQDLCAPESTSLIQERMHRVRETGEGRFEVAHFRKNGSTFPLEVHSKVIDWHGQPAFLAICTDLTDRKEAEAKEQEMQRRTTDILSGIADTFYSLDSQWRFTIVNPAAEKAPFGRPASELLGQVIWDLYPGLVGTPSHDHYLKAAANRTLEHYEVKSSINSCWYEVFMQGWEGGVDVYMRDISDRKKNEESLRISEERHRTILQATMAGFWLSDINGRLLEVNDTYCSMSGYTREELLAMHVSDLEAGESPEEVTAHIRTVMTLGQDRFETRHRRKNGSLYDVEINARYLPVAGGNFVIFLQDITDRKEYESSREVTLHLLQALHRENDLSTLLQNVTALMKTWSRCEAVGIRLKDGDDYPYFETRGFPEAFVSAERSLCAVNERGEFIRDISGNPALECMCGNIIHGRVNPELPFFTAFGSFWTNSTTELLASTTEVDRQARTRNRCHGEGYESVALIPLKAGTQCLGLLQFNDPIRNRFNAQKIALFESLASNLAMGLMQRMTAVSLRKSKEKIAETNQILSGVLENTHMMAVYLDPAFNFIWVNRAYAETCGEEPAFFPGKNHFDLYPDEENQTIFQQVADTGAPFAAEAKPFVFPDQPERGITYWDWSLIPVKDKAKTVTGLIFTLMDVTDRIRSEEAIREREELFRAAFMESQNALGISTLENGVWIDVNPVALDMFGYTRDEIIGVSALTTNLWVEPADRDELIARMLDTGMGRKENVRLRRKDGREIIARVSVRALTLKGEKLLLLNTEDLTRFKKMEQERKESEDRYRILVNTIPYGIQLSDLEGKILFSNPAHHRIQGYPEGALIGKHVWDLITDNDAHRNQARERYRWIIRDQPIPAAYYSQNTTQTGSLIDIRMDWDYVRNPKGEIEGVISVISDITEVKKAEAERERLLSAIEQSHETILITDITGAIQYANPSFEKTTGYTGREVLGKNPRFLKSGLQDQTLYQDLWNTISAGGVWTGRIINKRKDGTFYTEDAAITPVKDPQGKIVNYVAVKRDITKDIEMEKRISQSQRLEAIGTLAGGIAHDFNNLLFPILGLSEILMEDLPQESPEYENVEEIYKAARRGGDLVKQILSFSRQSIQQNIPVRLQHILKEALKLCRSAIPSNIEIKTAIRNDCGIVSADPSQIHQIVMNLITNAYHALEDTGGTIFVELHEVNSAEDDTGPMASLPHGRYAALTVSDTGCGIDPTVADKIFEPYFTTKTPGKGTGLGLSTVYGIVKEHGGDIQVSSELGKGATFTVWFPLLEKYPIEKETDESIPFQPGAERVLLIDDEEPIIRFEKQLLERIGYTVTTRTSSQEALSEFRENPNRFDLIITDMTMPKLTGDRLAAELLAIRPDLPIILCTGFSEKLTEKKIKALGIKGLLMKPVVKSDLYHMVRTVLDETKQNKAP